MLNVIDQDALIIPSGSRQDDFVIVLASLRSIVDVVKKYTPQGEFTEQYKFGLAGKTLAVMVRQPDGSYLPLAQNTQPIPDNTSFRNIVPAIRAHMK